MGKLKIPDERNEIEYSQWIPGAVGNYAWPARFEETHGFVAIDQKRDDGRIERVLLSPKQVRALLNFIHTFWR